MGWINGCAGCCAPYTLCTAVLLLVLSHCMEQRHWTFTVLAAKHNWSLVEKAQCCRNAATFYFCVSALMWVLFFNVHGWVLSCLRGVIGRRRNAVAYEMLLTAGGTPSYLTRSDGEDDDEDEGNSGVGNARDREMFFRVRGGATNLLHTDGVEVLTRSEAAGGGRAFSPLREPRRRTTPTPRAVTEEDVDDFRSDVDMNEGGANLEYKRSILNSEMERQQRQQQISSVTAWSSGQRRPARRGYRNNNNNNNNNRSNEPLPDHTALALPRRQRGAGGGEYSKSINEPQSPT